MNSRSAIYLVVVEMRWISLDACMYICMKCIMHAYMAYLSPAGPLQTSVSNIIGLLVSLHVHELFSVYRHDLAVK